MKRIMKITAVAFVIMLASSWRSEVSAQPYPPDQYPEGEVTYQTFYDELSPHGNWTDHPQYGYVWLPNAGPDFRPYSTEGHWVYTDNYEWMWVSDYDWGWAPFHYGRWDYDSYYGWFWVPGYEWSPAWVAWRDGGDYYGWAPIRPGITISVNFAIGSYNPPYDFWSFTPRRYILYNNVYNHCIDYRRNVTIINQTTIINNYNYSRNVYITGPRRSNVEVYTGRITPVRFREVSRPGRTIYRNNEVSIFRPTVRRDESRRFAPRTVERFDSRPGATRFDRSTNVRPNNNDGRIDRNNVGRRDADVRNGNNLPQRERNTTRPLERRNNEGPVYRPAQGNNDSRMNRGNDRVERDGQRVTGSPDREVRTQSPPAERSRGFERRSDQPVIRQPQEGNPGRQMNPRTERPSPQMNERRQVEQPRQMVPGRQVNPRVERPAPQMNERRKVEQPRQVERSQVPGRQMNQGRQEQPRQVENGRQERGNSTGSGNGNGRGRGRGN